MPIAATTTCNERESDNTPTPGNACIAKQGEGGMTFPSSKAADAIEGNGTDDVTTANMSSTVSSATRTSSVSNPEDEEKWWKSVYEKNPDFNDLNAGGKLILLLQILCHADMIGDKVVVFTQCLKTMDFLERVLQSPNWGSQVPAIATLSPGRQWGNWRKSREYLRIDGATSASDRGNLVNEFNAANVASACNNNLESQAKLFLISKEAGGVGINLYGKNTLFCRKLSVRS